MNICTKICRKISEWAWSEDIEKLECKVIRKNNECKSKTIILENLENELKNSNIDYNTVLTELKIIKLQNKKLDNLLDESTEIQEELKNKNKLIFGMTLTHTNILMEEDEVKTIIKESGTRARTLFNLDYTIELLNITDIKRIVEAFDINKVSSNENPALHLKSVFEASQFSECAFGIARNKNKYFNIFIGEDKKLYLIDLENKKIEEYNLEHRFTQYWI
jgi:galactitol-specific phosphotransferase system IIB component